MSKAEYTRGSQVLVALSWETRPDNHSVHIHAHGILHNGIPAPVSLQVQLVYCEVDGTSAEEYRAMELS